MSDYPSGIYSPRTKNNKSGVVYTPANDTVNYSEDVVFLDQEIVAIETELGLNPKGAFASVLARLNDVDEDIATIVTIHNNLSSKQGGIAGEYYHLSSAQVDKLDGIEASAEVNNISDGNATDLTDGGDTTLHDHDGIDENTNARHDQDTDTALGSGAVAKDHGTPATDEIVNICYGTSATPPTASTTTEGSLYVQYTA